MSTYPTSFLLLPSGDEGIASPVLAYFRSRTKNRIYEMVLTEFISSGISQATLARRLNKKPEVISRLLGAPGNWTSDTISDLLFAMRGGEISCNILYPLRQQEEIKQAEREVVSVNHNSSYELEGHEVPLLAYDLVFSKNTKVWPAQVYGLIETPPENSVNTYQNAASGTITEGILYHPFEINVAQSGYTDDDQGTMLGNQGAFIPQPTEIKQIRVGDRR